ncbi:MAG: hypothetical protein ACRD3Q_21995 [Terriglobales bacterium]
MVATKIDSANPDKLDELKKYCKKRRLPFYAISAVTGKGIPELLHAMVEKVTTIRRDDTPTAVEEPGEKDVRGTEEPAEQQATTPRAKKKAVTKKRAASAKKSRTSHRAGRKSTAKRR